MQWKDFLNQAESIVQSYRDQAPEGCDPKNTGIALGVGVAAVVAAGATAYAANEASSSQKDAASKNTKQTKNTNRLNYQMFQESRGSEGSAIYPIYATPSEKALYGEASNLFNVSSLPPEDQLALYQDQLDTFGPAQEGAAQAVTGLFNGQNEGQQIEALQPVIQARQEGVATRRQAGLEALQRTLNEIKATQNQRGFSGDSYGSGLLGFEARRRTYTDAANDQANTNLVNAQEVNRIKTGAINARLSNYQLPYQAARQSLLYGNLPEDQALDRAARRQQLFNNFRIGTQAFQYQPLPQVQPVTSTGQIIGQGIGAAAGSIGNYFAQRQLANQIAANQTPVYVNYGGTGLGTYQAPPTYINAPDVPITNASNIA